MEDILRPIYQERASQLNTLGILLIEKAGNDRSLTDTFDAVLLIVAKEATQPVFIKHYTYKNKKAALHIISEAKLNEWLLLGSNRKIFEWFYVGKIVFDRNEYIEKIKQELEDFPFQGRKLRKGLEFAKLIRRYMDGKAFFENQHYLDAYNHIVHSLHHLARLAVIENGFHPEITVWNQVKKLEPEIFKLYDELVNSQETLEKRLELLFLASEFLIHAKTECGTAHIVDLLKQRDVWTFNEIMIHQELVNYSVDLSMLLEYLIERNLIEVIEKETEGEVFHRLYKVNK